MGIIWGIIVILFVLWIIGLVFHFLGGFIYILLVIAVILAIINLISGRRVP